jgi:hypothetical protein
MRVILLTRDNRHYVLSEPATLRQVMDDDEMVGQLAGGGQVWVPVGNYAAQEVYGDDEMAYFRARLHEVKEECAAARAAGVMSENGTTA